MLLVSTCSLCWWWQLWKISSRCLSQGAAFFGGIIAKAGGEITRKKEKTNGSRETRMALGSNKSCQGPFHRIYALAPCTMIFLGVDTNLRVCSPYALRLALYALQCAPRESFPGSASRSMLTAAHCFESEANVCTCREYVVLLPDGACQSLSQSACMKHLHVPKSTIAACRNQQQRYLMPDRGDPAVAGEGFLSAKRLNLLLQGCSLLLRPCKW